mmetsp:Transcript_14427/g.31230  ORF Transcript_14427/g.31230 Transcript_14427/m.31230 type:complete len:118 (+) Transcript_14427:74-427(+)|eukprot:CAMPEP_0202892156 /NCGR_PEP_ID=MMETSP1392-20130828/1959_1 /ASSEMBLY_ACC=CAM_ASM_000868 /TAXON_ID=225041 /ORGANISM="Chlamydomonas chlamydogama, Strain SAG 11-48b" /LENGTH=117 /DNA_ID=CAMNT_0049576039 /DNA_START=72 /DNA_END=425 /DNA_ORIENTATION=+
MAPTPEDVDDGEQEQVEETSKDKQRQEQMKAMDKMTDMAPEKQLDESKVKQAMADLAASQKADKEAQRQREKELAAIKINKEDIDVVAAEFEIDKKVAERHLRERQGSLIETLKALL